MKPGRIDPKSNAAWNIVRGLFARAGITSGETATVPEFYRQGALPAGGPNERPSTQFEPSLAGSVVGRMPIVLAMTVLLSACGTMRHGGQLTAGEPVDPEVLQAELVQDQARRLTLDGVFSLADARSLSPSALAAAAKAGFLKSVRSRHVDDPGVLEHLGVTRSELEASDDRHDGLVDRGRDRLLEELGKQLLTEHTGQFDLGPYLGVRLGAEALPDDHRLVTSVPSRVSTTGNNVWARTFFALDPKGTFGRSVPVGGGVNLSLGFSTGTTIEGVVIAPYDVGDQLTADTTKQIAIDAAKNTTVRLPLELDDPMVPGQEAVLGGRGRISGSVGGRVGQELASLFGDRVTIGASAGVSINAGEQVWANVRVLELPGDLRLVAVTTGDEFNAGISADARVGFNTNIAGDIPGPSVIGDLANDQAKDRLNGWLGVNFNARLNFKNGEQIVGTFLFDRNSTDPEVARAYQKLLRLGAESAEAIAEAQPGLTDAGRPVGGIAYANFEKDYATRTGSVDARIGKLNLIKRIKVQNEEHGELTTTYGEQLEYWQATSHRVGGGLVTSATRGNRTLDRALTITRDGQGETSSYYHLAFSTQNDRISTGQNMLHMAVLAHRLGALEGHAHLLKDEAFLRSFDDTNRMVDVFFTDVEQLSGRSEVELIGAFGRAYDDADFERVKNPTLGVVPWRDGTLAPKLVRLLEWSPNPGDNERSRRYAQLTDGRSLTKDARAYQQMNEVIGMIRTLESTDDPAERVRIFRHADLGKDFWVPLAALANLVGPAGTMVDKLSVHGLDGDDRAFTFASEGRIRDPQSVIAGIVDRLHQGDATGARN